MHGLLPPSRTRAGLDAVETCLAPHEDEMEEHGIRVARLTTMVGDRLLLEPQFFRPDALSPFHLRAALAAALAAKGATHYQIGTYYPYLGRIDPGQRALIEAIKRTLDPNNLMSPGALGL